MLRWTWVSVVCLVTLAALVKSVEVDGSITSVDASAGRAVAASRRALAEETAEKDPVVPAAADAAAGAEAKADTKPAEKEGEVKAEAKEAEPTDVKAAETAGAEKGEAKEAEKPAAEKADAKTAEKTDADKAEAEKTDAKTAEKAEADKKDAKAAEKKDAKTAEKKDVKAAEKKDAKAAEKKDAKAAEKKKKPVLVNKVIVLAPAANVTSGDDIDSDGKCAKEVEALCKETKEGEGQLADCISDAITEAEGSETDGPTVSDDCREEVFQYKITRNSNINYNIPLAKACKADAEKYCNATWFFGYKAGQVTSCLRDNKAQVSKPCKQQLFKVMMDAANDFRADPLLYEACKSDAESVCNGTKNGGGRIQACLRDNRLRLSWACEEQLFRQEMENADDIRLSVRLFKKCLPDKKKFCKDIEPGNARTKECLEENREELSSGCKEEIDGMIERRVRDFRLDSKLRQACETEIFNMCAYFGDLDDIDTYDSSVPNCLQDFAAEIKNQECKEQVRKYVVLASQDIRFDVPLAEACYEDRIKFCSNVPPGSARVIRCLSNKRNQLSSVCRVTLFDEEVRFSENIDFQAPMKAACESEIAKFCKDVPHGAGRVIRCLQDKKGEKDFGKNCREEVESFEAEIGKDYRLNYRLKTACVQDIQTLCPTVCTASDGQICGGKVLRCLTDNLEKIQAEACQKEVHYFEKMEVTNFKNDILLAEACRADVDKFCGSVQAGEGRVHKCLRDNRKQLSDSCRKEELLLEEKEATSIELNVNLVKACKAERQLFCREVAAGSARVFRCLAENMNDVDFGATCKYQIRNKLQRRQSNWKLDPPLRKACRSDVSTFCETAESKNSEEGLVYKCLIGKFADLTSGCQKEIGRAVHMAFFVWAPNAILTSDCDEDINRMCLSQRPNMDQRPGAVGSCLASILEKQDSYLPQLHRMLAESSASAKNTGDRKLSPKCFVLADIAEPPNMKSAFESSLSIASLSSQLDQLGSKTGLPLTIKDRRGSVKGISLTGWVAMLGMAAFVLLVLFGTVLLYKRLRGSPEGSGYTLVVKQQPK